MSAPVVERSRLLGASVFDLAAYIVALGLNADALERSPEYRRAVTRTNPLLFALLYLPHHLKDDSTGGQLTFSEFHLDLCEHAKRWMRPPAGPGEERDCYVAPRGAGKSTWTFLILPMWAAAHGFVKFVGAFADSATQAQIHLQTFKMELDNNELLRRDFPELCTPLKRPTGQSVSDSRGMLVSQSGFIFAARGVTSSTLGMKVGSRRPDMLLLDDIEPQEGDYSAEQKQTRLQSVIESIFQLNIFARVIIAGTVTMHGSIIHDLVRTVTEPEPPESWPLAEKIRTHYYPALVTDDETGWERSLWPGKWPLAYLQSRRRERDFQKNMMNMPVGADGAYWTEEDFKYGTPAGITRVLLAVDPAVTSKDKSDFSGLAVVGWSPSLNQCVVLHAEGVKLTGKMLRQRVLKLLEGFPEIRLVLVEVNQGGELWQDTFHDLPGVKVRAHTAKVSKEVRFADALNHWQRGRVLHAQALPALEAQMTAFPRVVNDDIADATVAGVGYFLNPEKKVKSEVRVKSYL